MPVAPRCSAAVKAGVVEEFGRTQQILWCQKEEVQRAKTGRSWTVRQPQNHSSPATFSEDSGDLLSLWGQIKTCLWKNQIEIIWEAIILHISAVAKAKRNIYVPGFFKKAKKNFWLMETNAFFPEHMHPYSPPCHQHPRIFILPDVPKRRSYLHVSQKLSSRISQYVGAWGQSHDF